MALRPGHVIAITGAASGIGLSTAHMLASRHAYLALADINSSHLSTLERTIRASYPSCHIFTYTLDVRCEDNVACWLELVHTIFGRLDGAVNLAGIIPPSIGISGIDEQDVHEWRNVLDVNLTGTMLCMKYQIRLMKQNRISNAGDGVRGGSIVNASSIAGLRGMPRNAAYTASKHAVIGLTRTAAIENGKSGIRVNAICPGYIDTPMNVRSREIAEESGRTDERERKIKGVALGRGGKADEVAELICYLLGEGSGYVTGTAISVDGGWNC